MSKELRKISKTTGKMRKIRSDNGYDEKYAKQLKNGLRYKEKLSIPQLCRKWRISSKTYYNWIETYADFREAAEIGQMDFEAYRWEILDKLSTGELKGNAGAAVFGLENSNRSQDYGKNVNVHNTHEEKIETIKIEILPRKELNIIEHEVHKIENMSDDD